MVTVTDMHGLIQYFAHKMIRGGDQKEIYLCIKYDMLPELQRHSFALTVSYMGKYQDCFASVAQLVRALHRKCRAAGSIPARGPIVAFLAAKSIKVTSHDERAF